MRRSYERENACVTDEENKKETGIRELSNIYPQYKFQVQQDIKRGRKRRAQSKFPFHHIPPAPVHRNTNQHLYFVIHNFSPQLMSLGRPIIIYAIHASNPHHISIRKNCT